MRKTAIRNEWFRLLALNMAMSQVVTVIPAAEPSTAGALKEKQLRRAAQAEAAQPPPAPATVTVNRQGAKIQPPSTEPTFSANPTDQEIFAARVFQEPLVAIGVTSSAENSELARAIQSYLKAGSVEDVSTFEAFLRAHPESAWRAGLLANLGIVYRRTGYFSKALVAWEKAWQLSRIETETRARAIADVTLGELLALKTRLGRTEEVAGLLDEVKTRNVRGSAGEQVEAAKLSLWLMRNRPRKSFRCGPLALARVLALARGSEVPDAKIMAFPSTSEGTSLLQLRDLGLSVGLEVQMAKRSRGAEVLLPSVVHWRAGHFAAVVKQEGGKYLIQDPTFAEDIWVSEAAIDQESSGYFLTTGARLPAGWELVGDAEGGTVWGKGRPPNVDLKYQTLCEPGTGGNPGNGCPSCFSSNNGPPATGGMPVYSLQFMMLNLHITDTPLGYVPPVGPNVSFEMTYNSRDSFQPGIFRYSNLGPKWTFNWLSYVQDDPSTPQADVTVYLRGGGAQLSTGYNPATASYAPEFRSGAVIVRTLPSPIRYERRLSDGSLEVFSQPDGATAPRKVLLTSWADPAGNTVSLTYDSSLRVVTVTDAIGQVTTLSYNDPTDPLRITRVTDPFGRWASFQYNSSGELQQTTDVIGMVSQFTYGSGDFVSAMTTPYGTTTFNKGYGLHTGVNNNDGGDFPTLQATDPLGATEMMTYDVDDAPPGIPSQEAQVPQDFTGYNSNLWQETTFYWDKRAMSLYPGDYNHPPDYTKARAIHWLYNSYGGQVSGIPHSEKMPLENRIWYAYPGQADTAGIGTGSKPSVIARVLDDASSQIYRYEYNSLGKVCKKTDPLGRETRYTYGTNSVADSVCTTGSSIDLLTVEQKNAASPSGYDFLASYTYNAQHLPLTETDASGQTTTYTYNTAGQVLTIVTPPRGGLSEAERTTTYGYNVDGRLQSVTGPTDAATTSTYDGFGRIRTITDSDNYTLTYDYDALNRPTKVTYRDGTFEEDVYNRLDAEKHRDRLGRWSYAFHDALRRVVATRDPLGRTTTQQWCTCGSLDKIIDPSGSATTWERDGQGRITREVRGDSSDWEYTYENTTSRIKQRKDAKNQIVGYEYFLDNKLKQLTYTNAQVPTPNVAFTYDTAYGRPETMTDGTGTTNYSYYAVTSPPTLGAGRLQAIDGPLANDTVTFTYDELGRTASRTLGGVTNTYAFDALGRLNGLTGLLGTFSATFDGATNRPLTFTYPNGQTTQYTWYPNAADRRLQEIKHLAPGGGVLSKHNYTEDLQSNVRTWTRQVGSSPADLYELAYDSANQLTAATLKTTDPTPVILKRYGYTYDSAGNRTSEQVDTAVSSGTFNNRNQLTALQAGGSLLFRGTVSETATVTVQGKPAQVTPDNRFEGSAQTTSGTNTVAVTATDPSGNLRTNTYQVSVSGTAKTFSYDANGNLTGDGARTFEWDAENRLVAVNQGTRRSEFTYDGRGWRTRILEKDGATVLADRRLVWCGTDLCEERDAGGAVVKRYADHGFQQGGASYFYLRDHLGSIREVTDTAATIRARYDYDAFGRRTKLAGDVDADFGFTGHYFHAPSALSLAQYRAYDADLGRWLSEDPLGVKAGTNLYVYANGNPATLTDPAGLAAYLRCEPIPSTRGGGVIGAIALTLRQPTHCYIDIVCPGKWRVTIELYGPQPGAPNGRPMMNLPSAQRNQNASWSTIYPPGCGSNPTTYEACPIDDCSFEEELINQFNQNQPPPPYSPTGPNSNTFCSTIIRGAGGRTTFPQSAVGSGE